MRGPLLFVWSMTALLECLKRKGRRLWISWPLLSLKHNSLRTGGLLFLFPISSFDYDSVNMEC